LTTIRLEGVTKRFRDVVAVDRASFKVEKGEFFVLLGPSGCGKTTTLRIIAGFETPDEGRVYFNDVDVTKTKPYERETAMVFQNYALWPHMTVFENIAFGLKLRKLDWQEIKRRVDWALELVKLKGHEHKYPHQLSGGQQQRVALARALVVEPKVLLLDEPLSNLDAKLRIAMREELKELQRKLGITTVYVTHDQVEAMTLADRIAVMNKGRILQIGAPEEIYNYPANLFVATFIGRSNLIRGRIEGHDGEYLVLNSDELGAKLKGISTGNTGEPPKEGEEAYAVVRPEGIRLERPSSGEYNTLTATLDMEMFRGEFKEARFTVGNLKVIAYLDPDTSIPQGSRLTLYVKADEVKILRRPSSEYEQPS